MHHLSIALAALALAACSVSGGLTTTPPSVTTAVSQSTAGPDLTESPASSSAGGGKFQML